MSTKNPYIDVFVIDPREGPDHKGEIELKAEQRCRHEHSYTTMCGVTRCLYCDKVVG